MKRLGLVLLLCATLPGCIVLDTADFIHMATHHGRHIDDPTPDQGVAVAMPDGD